MQELLHVHLHVGKLATFVEIFENSPRERNTLIIFKSLCICLYRSHSLETSFDPINATQTPNPNPNPVRLVQGSV